MQNFFQASPENPYHLSIGAVLLDQENRIICHHFNKVGSFEDVYLLMTETIRSNETIENAIQRGLLEEFGATGVIERFLGTEIYNDPWFGETNKDVIVEKTVPFFVIKMTDLDEQKRDKEGREGGSKIVRMEKNDLLNKVEDQFERYNVNYLNFPKILKRL
ncbi:MAG: hypothetical protein Q9M91_01835 [Candidatus Dojkabacteria bacterium]|nr:hypothetical protein [Candidatus Dojkabacteria bacterium]MDQ7020565.1 hypothetical protein [Candidatus Dojkabacteria bacterium]